MVAVLPKVSGLGSILERKIHKGASAGYKLSVLKLLAPVRSERSRAQV